MDLNLRGKRAMVSGSTLGIGRSIAKILHAEGADVIINGRHQDSVAKTVHEMQNAEGLNPAKISGCAADLSRAQGVTKLVNFCQKEGPIDILINNVGIFNIKEFLEIEDNDWQEIFELNVMSGVRLSRAFLPNMLNNNWGRIIFIGSDQSSKPNPSMSHYAMTKTALVSISRSLAELTKNTEITVNTVQVAPTWTDGVKSFIEQMANKEKTTVEAMTREYFSEGEGQTSLIQRWADPSEIGNVVAFLCSPLASAINGSAPRADGGMVRSLF